MLDIKTVENIEITKNVFVKPEYLINSVINGNKLRKLKYNIQEFKITKTSFEFSKNEKCLQLSITWYLSSFNSF